MLVADRLGLPYIYVRPKPKEHGLGNQIEGMIDPGKKVVVVEDLISTGGSSLKAVDALRQAGFDVLGLTAIFTYGFSTAVEAFAKSGCVFNTLTNYDILISVAVKQGDINPEQVEQLKAWKSTVNQ
jgi:orotate phosphoribosyltransferase